jgi:RNA polymerase sigma factor (sigma-70 family)
VDGSDSHLQRLLESMNHGDAAARQELLGCAYERLRHLAGKMLRQDFPRLALEHETTSILHRALLPLFESLAEVRLPTVLDFFRLAAQRIRWVLLDLARQPPVQGAPQQQPVGASHDPAQLAVWGEFHRRVEELPDEEREVFEFVWYHGLTQAEAAKVLGVHPRTVSHRWVSACLRLSDLVEGFQQLVRDGR